MNQDIIHVYLMPGMAASSKIFEFIRLPEEEFKLHYLDWELPEPKDSLASYAKKMCKKIEHPKSVLLGVSFGGILVQEMSKYLDLKRLFVVSSIKSKHELPKRLALLRVTGMYKVLPTSLVKHLQYVAKYSYGDLVAQRLELYKKYLTMDDPVYLDWAIKEMIFWDQDEPLSDAIYIHGDKDLIFPHSCEGNCIVIEGGTHIMVINRARWFNENLPRLIKEGK